MSEAMRCKYISILHVYSEPGAAVTPISDKGLVESDSISALRRLILANLSWQSEITTHRLASSRSYINCAKKTWAWIWRWTSSSSSTMVLVVLHFSSPRPTVSESTDMSLWATAAFKNMTTTSTKWYTFFFAPVSRVFAPVSRNFAPVSHQDMLPKTTKTIQLSMTHRTPTCQDKAHSVFNHHFA